MSHTYVSGMDILARFLRWQAAPAPQLPRLFLFNSDRLPPRAEVDVGLERAAAALAACDAWVVFRTVIVIIVRMMIIVIIVIVINRKVIAKVDNSNSNNSNITNHSNY